MRILGLCAGLQGRAATYGRAGSRGVQGVSDYWPNEMQVLAKMARSDRTTPQQNTLRWIEVPGRVGSKKPLRARRPSFSIPPIVAKGGCRVRRLAICVMVLGVSSGCTISRLWAPSPDQVLERILPTSVQIVLERDGQRFRSGSGVAIAARPSPLGLDCFVLTSGHTLSRRSGQDRIFVLFGRHRSVGSKAPATVLAYSDSEDVDLALLRAHTNECFPAEFGRPPGLGDPIWVLAYPWGQNMTLVGGIVSQVNADPPGDRDTPPRLIVDASVSYGSSGGGVYDTRTGRLVGLVEGYRTARVSFKGEASQHYLDVPVPGETYVVPLADIQRFLIEADQGDLLGRPRVTANTRYWWRALAP